jgi:putative redox protein
MAQAHVTWVEEQTYIGIDSTHHSVVLSRPGEHSIGIKPSDLLLIAVAACANVDIVEIVKKRRATLSKMAVTVTGEQAAEAPWTFQKIHLHYEVSATGIDQDQLSRAIDLSLNKYCSVRSSLSPDVQVTFDCALT